MRSPILQSNLFADIVFITNMIWRTAELSDLETLQKCALGNAIFANNYGAVNTLLYKEKYGAQIAFEGGWFFEKLFFNGRAYFAFPHKLDADVMVSPKADAAATVSVDQEAAVAALASEAKILGLPFAFENITAAEKDALLKIYPDAKVRPQPEFGDYIYRAADLANLPGKKYGKKRNHINQFNAKYSDYKFEPLNAANLDDARAIEEKWLAENSAAAQQEGTFADLQAERDIIFNALDNFAAFEKTCGMTGGVLYVYSVPAAFCVASLLSASVTDVHFEKCLSAYGRDGGYAVINNQFAKIAVTEFLNREEDLGIEGLRKAKLSYYPERVLEKFSVYVN